MILFAAIFSAAHFFTALYIFFRRLLVPTPHFFSVCLVFFCSQVFWSLVESELAGTSVAKHRQHGVGLKVITFILMLLRSYGFHPLGFISS